MKNYPTILGSEYHYVEHIFGYAEEVCAYNTYQYKDYSRYDANLFNEQIKAEHKKHQFPIDCQKAYDMAQSLIKHAM